MIACPSFVGKTVAGTKGEPINFWDFPTETNPSGSDPACHMLSHRGATREQLEIKPGEAGADIPFVATNLRAS